MRFINNPFTDKLDCASLQGSGAPQVEFLTGNSGGQVGPDGSFNISVLGSNVTGINIVGSPGTSTLTVSGIASSTTQVGTTRYATHAEAAAQTSTTTALTPDDITSMFSTTPLPASQGGTGRSSPAAHSLLVTNGSSAFTVLGTATNGQLPIGSVGGDPVLSTLTAGSGVSVTNGPGTITIGTSASGFPISPYVVGPVGQAGYQTVQAGINAAHAAGGGTVYVQPGTYTENLTLYTGVDLWGAVGIADTATCLIIGVHTPPSSGTQTIRNIFLQSATHIYSSAVAGTAALILIDCAINVTNGFTFNCPNWTASGSFSAFDIGEIGSTNDGWVNNTGGAVVFMTNVTMGAGSSNIMLSSGSCELYNCVVKCPVNFVTGSSVLVDGGTLFQNSVTLSNNSTGTINNSSISSGTAAALTMSSSASWTISSCSITSSNNPAIAGAGAGTLTISDVTFLSNAVIAGTLTLGTSSVYPTKMSNGQLLIGSAGLPAVAANITSSGGTITVTNGAGTINLDLVGGTVAADSFSPDSGTDPVVPTAAGLVNDKGSGSITTVGSLNTITTQLTGLTNHNVLVGAGTSTITKVAPSATSGVPLISQGAAADPVFGTAVVAGGGTGAVTLTGVLTGNGTSAVTASTVTQHGVLLGGASNAVGSTAVGSTGQVFQANSAADPTYSTATYPSTATGTGTILRADGTNWVATTATYPATTSVSQLLYSSSANVVAGLATANRGVLTTSATGVPVVTALATDGQVIIGSTAGAPAAATLSAGTGISITNGSNSISIATNGSSTVNTLTGNSGGAISPTSGNINTLGTGSITIAGSGSTLTTQMTGLTNHAILVGAGTATITNVGPTATAGQVFQSAGSSADPVFSTATYPATATGTGTILRADGTNWSATTSTYPSTNAVSTLLYASSANVMGALATANNGALVTSNTGVPSILAGPGTTGNIFQSNSAAAPSFSTATYPSSTTVSQLLYSSSTNVVGGLATANNGVLTTGTSGIPVITALASNGQLIVGSGSGAPAAATLTPGAGISITNAANSITIAATGAGFTWTSVTGTTQTIVAENGYISNNAGTVTFTLPASGTIGDIFNIVGLQGAWTIAQNANQQIKLGSSATTVGVGGSLTSANAGDCISCVATNTSASTVWRVFSSIGNITVV